MNQNHLEDLEAQASTVRATILSLYQPYNHRRCQGQTEKTQKAENVSPLLHHCKKTFCESRGVIILSLLCLLDFESF